jgi:hypothetical protein
MYTGALPVVDEVLQGLVHRRVDVGEVEGHRSDRAGHRCGGPAGACE